MSGNHKKELSQGCLTTNNLFSQKLFKNDSTDFIKYGTFGVSGTFA
jgi:hypothetical protein